MAYENSAFPIEARLPMIPLIAFDKIVGIEIDGEWRAIANPHDASTLLLDAWPTEPGPSHHRAVIACNAAVHGGGSIIGARAAFSVAAMEAGLPFDLFDDQMAFLEFQMAAATVSGIRQADREEQ